MVLVAFLRCQEIDGWDSNGCFILFYFCFFCFYFEGRGFAWSIVAGLSAIKTCRSHDLVSSVLFCSVVHSFSSTLSLSLPLSTYPHMMISHIVDGICCSAIVLCYQQHHAILPVWLVWISVGICVVYSQIWQKFSCSFFIFFIRKIKEDYFSCFSFCFWKIKGTA